MASERFAYIHCKPDGTPFYVGKGALRRAKYLGERNGYHQAVVNKYGRKNILIGMLPCSSNEAAYELERGLIKRLRLMGVSLANFTAGGDGGKDPVPETRKRLSEAAKRRGISQECRKASVSARKGKPLSDEQKAKISASMKGIVRTQEHLDNIRKSAIKRGMPRSLLEKAWAASRGRVRPKEERDKRAATLRATLAAKKALKESQS